MTIEYRDGKMFVTHSTGVVDEYEVSWLQYLRALEVYAANECQYAINRLDEYITNAEASGNTPQAIG